MTNTIKTTKTKRNREDIEAARIAGEWDACWDCWDLARSEWVYYARKFSDIVETNVGGAPV